MTRSTLDPDNLPAHPARKPPPGHDIRSLGPSDSSDTGADMAGPGMLDEDQLGLDRGTNEPNVADGADIGFDRIVGPEDAGLGAGLDQAEEAQLGITDEEIEAIADPDRDA